MTIFKKEVFLTPGLVLRSFPLAEQLHLTVGGGGADRRDMRPPVQPWLDSLSALSVLSSLCVNSP
jgi:hypothetical protein